MEKTTNELYEKIIFCFGLINKKFIRDSISYYDGKIPNTQETCRILYKLLIYTINTKIVLRESDMLFRGIMGADLNKFAELSELYKKFISDYFDEFADHVRTVIELYYAYNKHLAQMNKYAHFFDLFKFRETDATIKLRTNLTGDFLEMRIF